MTTPAVSVLKHAFVGSVVGEATAMVAQRVSTAVTSALAPSFPGGPIGSMVARGVIAGSVTALCVLGGDSVLSMLITDNDPLFRMFFYQVVFHSSPAYGIADATRALIGLGMRSVPSAAPRPHTHTPGEKCDDCTKTGKSCGGCSGH